MFKPITYDEAIDNLIKYMEENETAIRERYKTHINIIIEDVIGTDLGMNNLIQRQLYKYHKSPYWLKLDPEQRNHENRKFKRNVKKFVRVAFPENYFRDRNNARYYKELPENEQKNFRREKMRQGREAARVRALMDE